MPIEKLYCRALVFHVCRVRCTAATLAACARLRNSIAPFLLESLENLISRATDCVEGERVTSIVVNNRSNNNNYAPFLLIRDEVKIVPIFDGDRPGLLAMLCAPTAVFCREVTVPSAQRRSTMLILTSRILREILLPSLRHISHLVISDNPNFDNEDSRVLADCLASSQCLETLEISGSSLESVEHLRRLTTLRELRITFARDVNLVRFGLAGIDELTALKTLDLSYCGGSGGDAAGAASRAGTAVQARRPIDDWSFLLRMPSLTTFNAAGSAEISEAQMYSILSSSSLISVSLAGSRRVFLPESSAATTTRRRRACETSSLRTLVMSNCAEIGNVGQFSDFVRDHLSSCLQTLNLSRVSDFDDDLADQLARLAACKSSLTFLDVSGTHVHRVGVFSAANFPCLEELNVACCNCNFDSAFAGFGDGNTVHSLKVLNAGGLLMHRNASVGWLTTQVASKLLMLEELDLCQNLAIVDIACLATLPKLQVLNLAECTRLRRDAAKQLAGSPSLVSLKLAGSNIDTVAGLHTIPTLRFLDVSRTLVSNVKCFLDIADSSKRCNLERLTVSPNIPIHGLVELEKERGVELVYK